MFGFGFLESPASIKRRREYEKEKAKEMVSRAVHFDPKMRWQKELCITAASYNEWLAEQFLFPDLQAVPTRNAFKEPRDHPHILSPGGDMMYIHHRTFPGKTALQTLYGKNEGTVWFTGPVTFPVLLRAISGKFALRDNNVWMSLTPMEIFTLRGGTRRAKGHVVVAGLGLGYQLMEVCRRPQVKRVTLVEIDRALMDWLLPVIRRKLGPDAKKIRRKILASDK